MIDHSKSSSRRRLSFVSATALVVAARIAAYHVASALVAAALIGAACAWGFPDAEAQEPTPPPEAKAPATAVTKAAPAPAASGTSGKTPEMLLVPAGEFQMGAAVDDKYSLGDDKPLRRVILKAFRISRFEVTNAQYRSFLAATATQHPKSCSPFEPSGTQHAPEGPTWSDPEWNDATKPVVSVTWFDAYAYCAWDGKRLPSEAEWEKAARGTDARVFPWGPEIMKDSPVANIADEAAKREYPAWRVGEGYDDGFVHTSPVGSFPNGASPYGVEDMAGNVWEWVADWYSPAPYGEPGISNPTGPAVGDWRVLRGGSWDSTLHFIRATARHHNIPGFRSKSFGIRCAQDVAE